MSTGQYVDKLQYQNVHSKYQQINQKKKNIIILFYLNK
jgi:hypothetical protein